MPDGIDQLGTKLAEALAPKRRELVTVSYGTVKAVNETEADVRLDVDLHGGTLYGLPMTTSCKGVAVGDRVIVQTYGHLSTVTGVIAHDNSHYVILGEGDCSVNSMVNHVVAVGYPQLNILALSAQRTSGYFSTSGASVVTSDAAFTLPEEWRLPAASTFTSLSDHSPSWSVDFRIDSNGDVRMICTVSGAAQSYGYNWASAVILMQLSS